MSTHNQWDLLSLLDAPQALALIYAGRLVRAATTQMILLSAR